MNAIVVFAFVPLLAASAWAGWRAGAVWSSARERRKSEAEATRERRRGVGSASPDGEEARIAVEPDGGVRLTQRAADLLGVAPDQIRTTFDLRDKAGPAGAHLERLLRLFFETGDGFSTALQAGRGQTVEARGEANGFAALVTLDIRR